MEKLSIEERLALLKEAENFFADLSSAGEKVERLGLRKAAALSTVSECLELYKNKMLEGKDWTEETLAEGLATVLEKDYINRMIEINGMDEEEAAFYKGGFGLAIGLVRGDKEDVDGLKELEEQYSNIEEMVAGNRTFADLLK